MNATRTTRGSGREALGLLVVLGLGAVHFALFFSDVGPGETFGLRLAQFFVVAFLAGTVLGAFVPRWMIYCAVSSWGALLGGAMLLVMHETLGLYIGAGSLVAVLVGGTAGALLRRFLPASRPHQPMP